MIKKQDLSFVGFGQVFLDIVKYENGENVIHLEELDKVKRYPYPTTFFIRVDMFAWDVWFSTPERIKSLYTVWNFIVDNKKHTFIIAVGSIKLLIQVLKKKKVSLPPNMRIAILYYDAKDLKSKITWIYKVTERFMVLPYDKKEKVKESAE